MAAEESDAIPVQERLDAGVIGSHLAIESDVDGNRDRLPATHTCGERLQISGPDDARGRG